MILNVEVMCVQYKYTHFCLTQHFIIFLTLYILIETDHYPGFCTKLQNTRQYVVIYEISQKLQTMCNSKIVVFISHVNCVNHYIVFFNFLGH
jgi:hypothetical protein